MERSGEYMRMMSESYCESDKACAALKDVDLVRDLRKQYHSYCFAIPGFQPQYRPTEALHFHKLTIVYRNLENITIKCSYCATSADCKNVAKIKVFVCFKFLDLASVFAKTTNLHFTVNETWEISIIFFLKGDVIIIVTV